MNAKDIDNLKTSMVKCDHPLAIYNIIRQSIQCRPDPQRPPLLHMLQVVSLPAEKPSLPFEQFVIGHSFRETAGISFIDRLQPIFSYLFDGSKADIRTWSEQPYVIPCRLALGRLDYRFDFGDAATPVVGVRFGEVMQPDEIENNHGAVCVAAILSQLSLEDIYEWERDEICAPLRAPLF